MFGEPEPSVPTVAGLISNVEALDVHHGIKNSLLKKLAGVQEKLDSGNESAAHGKLEAFIAELEAQSGKKVSAETATELIADAREVLNGESSGGCTA
jgi:hypothetical protein